MKKAEYGYDRKYGWYITTYDERGYIEDIIWVGSKESMKITKKQMLAEGWQMIKVHII